MKKSKFAVCSLVLILATIFLNIFGNIFCSAKVKSVVALEKKIYSTDGAILVEKARQAEQISLNQLINQADTFGFKEPTLVVYASLNKKVAVK